MLHAPTNREPTHPHARTHVHPRLWCASNGAACTTHVHTRAHDTHTCTHKHACTCTQAWGFPSLSTHSTLFSPSSLFPAIGGTCEYSSPDIPGKCSVPCFESVAPLRYLCAPEWGTGPSFVPEGRGWRTCVCWAGTGTSHTWLATLTSSCPCPPSTSSTAGPTLVRRGRVLGTVKGFCLHCPLLLSSVLGAQ